MFHFCKKIYFELDSFFHKEASKYILASPIAKNGFLSELSENQVFAAESFDLLLNKNFSKSVNTNDQKKYLFSLANSIDKEEEKLSITNDHIVNFLNFLIDYNSNEKLVVYLEKEDFSKFILWANCLMLEKFDFDEIYETYRLSIFRYTSLLSTLDRRRTKQISNYSNMPLMTKERAFENYQMIASMKVSINSMRLEDIPFEYLLGIYSFDNNIEMKYLLSDKMHNLTEEFVLDELNGFKRDIIKNLYFLKRIFCHLSEDYMKSENPLNALISEDPSFSYLLLKKITANDIQDNDFRNNIHKHFIQVETSKNEALSITTQIVSEFLSNNKDAKNFVNDIKNLNNVLYESSQVEECLNPYLFCHFQERLEECHE